MILIQAFVNIRDLALAKSVAESVVDILHRNAEPAGGSAVNNDIASQTTHLLVGIDVAQFGDFGDALLDERRPVS